MSGKHELTRNHAASMLAGASLDAAAERVRPHFEDLPHAPGGSAKVSRERALALWGGGRGGSGTARGSVRRRR